MSTRISSLATLLDIDQPTIDPPPTPTAADPVPTDPVPAPGDSPTVSGPDATVPDDGVVTVTGSDDPVTTLDDPAAVTPTVDEGTLDPVVNDPPADPPVTDDDPPPPPPPTSSGDDADPVDIIRHMRAGAPSSLSRGEDDDATGTSAPADSNVEADQSDQDDVGANTVGVGPSSGDAPMDGITVPANAPAETPATIDPPANAPALPTSLMFPDNLLSTGEVASTAPTEPLVLETGDGTIAIPALGGDEASSIAIGSGGVDSHVGVAELLPEATGAVSHLPLEVLMT